MKLFRKLSLLLILLCFTSALAQDAICTDLVEQAMAAVEDDCAPTGRNQACYGYVALEATPRENVQNFTFAQEGDLVNVADLQTLRLSALDVENNTWGIALMKLQANLPDTLPGQNVTFLMFGDVEIQNAVEASPELPTIEVAANGGNVRSGPSTDYSIAGSLAAGETVTANGRNEDSSWLRIQIPDSDSLGWVRVDLLTTEDDISQLTVVDASDTEIPFTPMQAFYFSTGITETGCEEAPPDGILIQTPEGAGQINLRANDVDIQLGSTAYFQAEAGEQMTVSVVEGESEITSDGETVVVPAGSQVQIPMDEDLRASGAPSEPQPYDDTALQTLPIQVLPQEIAIAPPTSEEELQASAPGGGAAPGGLPGGLDPAMFAGLDPALFCSMMVPAIEQSGMSMAEYIDAIRQVSGYIPAEDRAEFDQFLLLLESCT